MEYVLALSFCYNRGCPPETLYCKRKAVITSRTSLQMTLSCLDEKSKFYRKSKYIHISIFLYFRTTLKCTFSLYLNFKNLN